MSKTYLEKDAKFSKNRIFRYTLWRKWKDLSNGYVMFICLNPSTADENVEDPDGKKMHTVRR